MVDIKEELLENLKLSNENVSIYHNGERLEDFTFTKAGYGYAHYKVTTDGLGEFVIGHKVE